VKLTERKMCIWSWYWDIFHSKQKCWPIKKQGKNIDKMQQVLYTSIPWQN